MAHEVNINATGIEPENLASVLSGKNEPPSWEDEVELIKSWTLNKFVSPEEFNASLVHYKIGKRYDPEKQVDTWDMIIDTDAIPLEERLSRKRDRLDERLAYRAKLIEDLAEVEATIKVETDLFATLLSANPFAGFHKVLREIKQNKLESDERDWRRRIIESTARAKANRL